MEFPSQLWRTYRDPRDQSAHSSNTSQNTPSPSKEAMEQVRERFGTASEALLLHAPSPLSVKQGEVRVLASEVMKSADAYLESLEKAGLKDGWEWQFVHDHVQQLLEHATLIADPRVDFLQELWRSRSTPASQPIETFKVPNAILPALRKRVAEPKYRPPKRRPAGNAQQSATTRFPTNTQVDPSVLFEACERYDLAAAALKAYVPLASDHGLPEEEVDAQVKWLAAIINQSAELLMSNLEYDTVKEGAWVLLNMAAENSLEPNHPVFKLSR